MIVLVCALVLCVFASPVFATDKFELRSLEGGGYFAGTLPEDIDWAQEGEPKGPHGGYDTTSSKCITCHSVHGAVATDVSGEAGGNIALLRSATGCAYCHTAGAPAAPNGTPDGTFVNSNDPFLTPPKVYIATGGKADAASFSEEKASGHALGVKGNGIPASSIDERIVLSCSTCHIVHGSTAGAWLPTDFFDPTGTGSAATSKEGYKFLRINPSGQWREPADSRNVPQSSTDSFFDDGVWSGADVDLKEVNQFTLSFWCANCHDKALQPDAPQRMADVSGDTFEVSGSWLGNAHLDWSSNAIAEEYAPGMSHRSPMVGAYTGTAQCYTCHRAGLSVRGVAVDLDAINTLPLQYHDAFVATDNMTLIDADSKAKCARCHYGFANYAIDINRDRAGKKADFPHSSANDIKLLGDFTLDGADPYELSSISTDLDWSPIREQPSVQGNEFRSKVCGRCHVADDRDDVASQPWITFGFSYKYNHDARSSGDGWSSDLPFGGNILFSPGTGATP